QQRKWDVAAVASIALLERAKTSSQKQKARAIQAFLQREKQAQTQFRRAEQAFLGGNPQQSLTLLNELPTQTSFTLMAQKMRRKSQQAIAQEPLEQAQQLARQRKYPLALQTISKLLEVDPSIPQARSAYSNLRQRILRKAKRCHRICKRRYRRRRFRRRRARCKTSGSSSYPQAPKLPPLFSISNPPQPLASEGQTILSAALGKPVFPKTEPASSNESSTQTDANPQQKKLHSCWKRCARKRGRRSRYRCKKRCLYKCTKAAHRPFHKTYQTCRKRCTKRRRCRSRRCRRCIRKCQKPWRKAWKKQKASCQQLLPST
ncbi:MAG: hypothetical protein AAGJ35_14950, partial [Myxococcota bacterium]